MVAINNSCNQLTFDDVMSAIEKCEIACYLHTLGRLARLLCYELHTNCANLHILLAHCVRKTSIRLSIVLFR